MATRLGEARIRALEELRYEPTEKRVRAVHGEHTVADTTRAVLVWEPRRVLPSYAVPPEDLRGELVPASPAPEPDGAADAPILHGGFPFTLHSTEGEALSVRAGSDELEGAAFRSTDPDLDGYVVLDFHAFDTWYEEEEPIVAHPRDPFHRVDIRRSSRQVRVELGGELLAQSSRPHIVFETSLPPRFYLPREDVLRELRPTEKPTRCAYKGEGVYMSVDVNGEARGDLAWSYDRPLPDAARITNLVAFFDEKVDVTVDGKRREVERRGIAGTIVDEAGA